MDISDYEEGEYLEDEYEELEPTTSGKRTRGGGKAGGYQLKNVLKLPRATTYSTQALYGMLSHSKLPNNAFRWLTFRKDQIHASDIDLEPEYQRGMRFLSHKPAVLGVS